MSTDPHAPEYAAAISGMADLYGSPPRYPQPDGGYLPDGRLVSRWAVGDLVRWHDADGTHEGLVIEVLDADRNTYHVVERVPGTGRIHYELDGDAIAPW